MPQENLQDFTKYFSNSWTEVREALLSLSRVVVSTENEQIYNDIRLYTAWLVRYVDEDESGERKEACSSIISMLDIDKANHLLKNIQDVGLLTEVGAQIYHLAASMNLFTQADIYSPEELTDVFTKEGYEYDELRILMTIRQAIMGLDTEKYLEPVLAFLEVEDNAMDDLLSWSDALILAMLLHLVWENYSVLRDQDTKFIIENYFYRALVVGVPVKYILQNHFFTARELYDFIFRHSHFVSSFENNKERVLVNVLENQYKPLLELVNVYRGRVGDKLYDGYAQQEYVKGFYEGLPGRDKYISWLLEVFFIYFHTERVELIDNPLYEVNEYQKFNNELAMIFGWLLVQNRWSKIVDYYKKENPLVNLKVVLRHCSNNFDLEKDTSVQIFVDFCSFLQEHGILKEGENIIEFHEEDNKFHWNEDLLA